MDADAQQERIADPERIAKMLGMAPIPIEGGRLAQTWVDGHSSAISYLITESDFSGLHALPHPEVWFFHDGSPASMLLLHPDGRVEEPVLGPDLAAGQQPQVAVPPGVVMAVQPQGAWSLLGTYMAPPYEEGAVDFPRADDLVLRYPAAAERIRRTARR